MLQRKPFHPVRFFRDARLATSSASTRQYAACARFVPGSSPLSRSFSASVLTNGFQHYEPRLALPLLHLPHQALIHQRAHAVQQVQTKIAFRVAHRFHALQIAPAREHRKSPEQPLLWPAQQVVTPIHRRPKRLLPFGRSRAPPVSSCRRLLSLVSREDGAKILIRAAASSIASGNPSSRAQISATAPALSLPSLKSGLTATARCRNSATAGYCDRLSGEDFPPGSGSASGGKGNSCSPYTCSADRLVTMIFRFTPVANNSATVPAAAVRCSKLSSTSSMGGRAGSCKCCLTISSGDRPPASPIPNVCTIADPSNPGSLSDESETK